MDYPLSPLFRSLIDIHTIQTEWKNSIIIPKFKKGAPSDPSNYRPIALTCTCCEILESIISCELSQYLFEHKLIIPHQHGFLKRHSTSTNLLESTYDWKIALSNRNSVSVAYIDFKSAFDRISHSKLLLKLSSYGINGSLLFGLHHFYLTAFNLSKLTPHFQILAVSLVVYRRVVSLVHFFSTLS